VQFARPPGGFRVSETPEVTKRVAEAASTWPALVHIWTALRARLALVGHREGTVMRDEGSIVFVLAADCLGIPGSPELKVLYSIVGIDLCILSALITPPTKPSGD
jgi:hypothetical protein